jgi:hypothetical protein
MAATRRSFIRDVRPRGQAGLTLPPAERQGFVISGADIVFRGFCPECAGRTPNSGPAAGADPRRYFCLAMIRSLILS